MSSAPRMTQSDRPAPAKAVPTPTPTPSPTPTPTPRYRLIPYGFETDEQRSALPLLRFSDSTEVRSLEMNAAIARFFDSDDDKGSMLRGATPGGAPTREEMKNYRPSLSPAIDFFSLFKAAMDGFKTGRERGRMQNGEKVLRDLLLKSATPTPTPDLFPQAGTTPTPTPSPTPTP